MKAYATDFEKSNSGDNRWFDYFNKFILDFISNFFSYFNIFFLKGK